MAQTFCESRCLSLLCAFIFLLFLHNAQSVTTSLEGQSATVTIIVPPTDESVITIKHNTGLEGEEPTDALFVIMSNFGVKKTPNYQATNIWITASAPDRRVDIRFENAEAWLAGMYECFKGGTKNKLDNCGDLLVIVRKPDPPVIQPLPASDNIIGSDLELVCGSNSNSLPPNHGLTSQIFWQTKDGLDIVSGGQVSREDVTENNHLLLRGLSRRDEGLQFQCSSADDMDAGEMGPVSDPSVVYTVLPEFKPEGKDLTTTPSFINGETIEYKLGKPVSYMCAAVCRPECTISWRYKAPTSGSNGAQRSYQAVRTVSNDPTLLQFNTGLDRQGFYRCKAENIHGRVTKSFYLDVLYITAPQLFVNGGQFTSAKIEEDQPVELRCVFDSNPVPNVSWLSPSGEVLSQGMAEGPNVTFNDQTKHLSHAYTSEVHLTDLKCEDSGIYSCLGENSEGSQSSKVDLLVTCQPTAIGLQDEYVWEIPLPLKVEFVIKAMPHPTVKRIMSFVNGVTKLEDTQDDFVVGYEHPYQGKQYLTQVTLTSRRQLDLSDMNRKFTVTVETSEYTTELSFVIRPRGPPHKVTNLTTFAVGARSLTLVWLPGFDGGMTQSFSIQHQKTSSTDGHWTTALEGVTELERGARVEGKIKGLSPSTEYYVRVMAINSLGNSTAKIVVVTLAAPSEGMEAGAVVGIVFGVLIAIALIGLILFYFLVYRKRQGATDAEGGETSKPMLPKQLTNIIDAFRRNKSDQNGDAGGAADGGAEESKLKTKWRNLLAKFKTSHHDDSDSWSDEFDEDEEHPGDEYENANELKPLPKKEHIYANARVLNNNEDQPKKKEEEKMEGGTAVPTEEGGATPNEPEDSGRTTNDDGLVYISVAFPDNPAGNNQPAPEKKREKVPETEYQEIDFSKRASDVERAKAAEAAKAEGSEPPPDEKKESDGKIENVGMGTAV